ncbi:MAG: inositol monophosphatase family protein [Planctomycetota bacterium]
MTSSPPTATPAEFDLATHALREAMQLALEYRDRGVEAEEKEGGSPVTEADRAIDRLLFASLIGSGDDGGSKATAYGWLSEESADSDERLSRERVWVVDPIDGTRAFLAGRDDYSVSIGLLVAGQPVLGAIGCPARNVTVVGGVGRGVELTGDPALRWPERVLGGRPLPHLLASRSEMKRGVWRELDGRATVQPVGSVAYKLALVAAGCADGTWTKFPKHEWDVAAGAALVNAAGGETWLPRGGHMRWNRSRPRFLSFAAAGSGLRERVEALVPADR